MAGEVNVKRIETLGELGKALGHFAATAPQALEMAEAEVTKTLEYLKQRETFWQQQVAYWRQQVELRRNALRRCEQQAARQKKKDKDPCAHLRAELREAERQLEAAEKELRNVRYWINKVKHARTQFQSRTKRFKQLTDDSTQRARAFLNTLQNDLQKFIDERIP